ncbi:hypothetical protein [Mycoplasmopsis synoviae]|nr:hypothetical protein [Mycoplasmopsis synoviae]AKB10973.1 hypothetical protein VY93_01095 [Mycoplasmopsis synoviae ATCC 25204]
MKNKKLKLILVSSASVLALAAVTTATAINLKNTNYADAYKGPSTKSDNVKIAEARLNLEQRDPKQGFVCNCAILLTQHYGWQHTKNQEQLIKSVLDKAILGETLSRTEQELLDSLAKDWKTT